MILLFYDIAVLPYCFLTILLYHYKHWITRYSLAIALVDRREFHGFYSYIEIISYFTIMRPEYCWSTLLLFHHIAVSQYRYLISMVLVAMSIIILVISWCIYIVGAWYRCFIIFHSQYVAVPPYCYSKKLLRCEIQLYERRAFHDF